MKPKFLAVFTAALFLMGLTGCSKADNPSTDDLSVLEQSLVGLWWDEYEYADVTEEGVPFSRVLLAVRADADHTGCIYLGVFDDKNNEPLAVYGGPEDAGFAWHLLNDGRIVLSDPVTSESYALARSVSRVLSRADGGGSYGSSMTDVSSTEMSYTDGNVTVTNDSYSGKLTKANAEQEADIKEKLQGVKRYPIALSEVTSDYAGSVVTSDGDVYPPKTAVPTGCTAVGILGKVTATGHGLILALHNATEGHTWRTINSWTSETSYAGTTLKVLPDDAARGPLKSYTTLGSTTVSNWAVAKKSDYEAIFTNLGSKLGNRDGKAYDANVNAYIDTGTGGSALGGNYWSATEYDYNCAWSCASGSVDGIWRGDWHYRGKGGTGYIRPVLGF